MRRSILAVLLLVSCAESFPGSRREDALKAALILTAAAANTGPCNGQGFCYIFATSGAWLGDLGGTPGISGADARCSSDSSKPVAGTYKALLSDGSTRIASTTANSGSGQTGWVLYASTQYRRPDGLALMTTDANKLFVFGTLANPMPGASTYHTGMLFDWTSGANCSSWADGSGASQGRFGSGGVTGNTVISLSQTACNTVTRGLYCVQQ